MAKAKIALDPQTERCVKELKLIIADIESGELLLRRYADILAEDQGLHREVSIRTTFKGTMPIRLTPTHTHASILSLKRGERT
jgi:hypothetical protein